MTDSVVSGYEGIKFVTDANTTPKGLFIHYSTGGFFAIKDGSTNAAYTPPAGKKFIVLKISWQCLNNTSGGLLIYDHNVADASGGTQCYGYAYTTQAGNVMMMNDMFYHELAAGQYLNVQNYGTNAVSVSVFGVEMNV